MFGEALKNENKTLFHQMMKELDAYQESMKVKDSIQVTESLLMALVHIQQKMIKELMSKHPHKSFSPSTWNEG